MPVPPIRALAAALVAAVLILPGLRDGPAQAGPAGCRFEPVRAAAEDGSAQGEAAAVILARLPGGITKGWVRCPGERASPLVVWTLRVGEEDGFIGVRDGPLFSSLPQNPLVAVAAVGIGTEGRFHTFLRSETVAAGLPQSAPEDRRPAHRLFGTLCDSDAADPLDCSFAGRRVKMRVDVVDNDFDGALDLARHELSILHDGRLQVLRFARPHEPDPLRVMSHWIAALTLSGHL
ncbi:MAG: hypothetical protein AAFV49_05870 [Pseudomonadota bacterium]